MSFDAIAVYFDSTQDDASSGFRIGAFSGLIVSNRFGGITGDTYSAFTNTLVAASSYTPVFVLDPHPLGIQLKNTSADIPSAFASTLTNNNAYTPGFVIDTNLLSTQLKSIVSDSPSGFRIGAFSGLIVSNRLGGIALDSPGGVRLIMTGASVYAPAFTIDSYARNTAFASNDISAVATNLNNYSFWS